MRRLFGTDGVRGAAGSELTPGLAMSLSVAAARVFAARGAFALAAAARRRPVAVVGRDPRASGEFLEAAVVAGLASRGVDVHRLGVVPTPAVAFLTADLDADFGVMLSASHNPAADNGIKFFARGGLKLPDEVESDIEAALAAPAPDTVPPGGFGRVREASQAADRYLAHLLATVGVLDTAADITGPVRSARPLAGLRVVVDCAHGAAYRLAPLLLRRAGAEVIVIGADPDGDNINAGCGSTSLGSLTRAVLEHGADAGIAHDGDADRCLAVDAAGQVVDGDQILTVLALDRQARGQLAKDTVVSTVMSNLGFRRAMRAAGISVRQTQVGDRYLVAEMQAGGFELGGEQSGHIILLDHATTGDGLLTALHLLTAVAQSGQPLARLAAAMTRYPQVLINIADVDKASVTGSGLLHDAVAAAEDELGESGRVLIRPSGTEPAVRVMVEAMSREQAERLAGRLADTVRSLG